MSTTHEVCGDKNEKNEKNVDSLSFRRGVVRPGVTGEEHFLVSELWERPGDVHVEADLHGEAGPEPSTKLE